MIKKLFYTILIIAGLYAQQVHSATLYMGSGETYTNLQSAIAAMSGGDTLIIRDGTYTGSSNMITDTNHPVSGSSGSWTTIMAEHPGKVIFDGEYYRNMFYIDGNNAGNINWIKFSGLIWKKTATQAAVTFVGRSGSHNTHVWFSQCGFSDAGVNGSSSSNGLYLRYTDYALIEDCYTWGELYYGLLFEQCSYSIMRRCVARYDIHRGARGGAIGVYSSSNIELQNCIAIDCDSASTYTGVTEGIYGFAFPTTDGPSTNIFVRGCIALNLNADGEIITGLVSSNGGGSGFLFDDFIAYDTSGGFWDRLTGNSYTNCVFGLSKGNLVVEGIAGAGTLTYSLIFGNVTRGSNVTTTNYNDYYNNGTPGNTGTGNVTVNPETSGYLYLPRIETGSVLEGYGMGPDVTKIIGTSGTFYGETGYNTETSTDLWPYPNEDLIQDAFAAYTGNSNGSVTGARGFCASGTRLDGVNPITLTSYIWEYLGNEIPEDIYGESPVYDTPIVEILTESQSTTSGTITIIGTLTTDSELTGTGVDVNGIAATADDGTWDEAVEAWTALGVTLSLGANTITATGTDSEAETDTDTVIITRTAPGASAGVTLQGVQWNQ